MARLAEHPRAEFLVVAQPGRPAPLRAPPEMLVENPRRHDQKVADFHRNEEAVVVPRGRLELLRQIDDEREGRACPRPRTEVRRKIGQGPGDVVREIRILQAVIPENPADEQVEVEEFRNRERSPFP